MNELKHPARRKMAVITILSLLLMGYIDHISGYEIVFSCAYLVPVALCAWHFGRRSIVLMSLAGGVISFFADKFSNHPYSHDGFFYANSTTCFVISIVTGLMLHRLRNTLAERKRANEELKNALEELERSTQEIRKLQDGLQLVCAWTKRIKVGDQWMTSEQFLSTQLHLKLTHGMSPEARLEFKSEMDKHRSRENAPVVISANEDSEPEIFLVTAVALG